VVSPPSVAHRRAGVVDRLVRDTQPAATVWAAAGPEVGEIVTRLGSVLTWVVEVARAGVCSSSAIGCSVLDGGRWRPMGASRGG
jgi:hypothetical protein